MGGIFDAIGNPLHEGDIVHIKPDGKTLIGRIVAVRGGGVLVGNDMLPASIIVVIDMEMGGPPGIRLKDILSLRKPPGTQEIPGRPKEVPKTITEQ